MSTLSEFLVSRGLKQKIAERRTRMLKTMQSGQFAIVGSAQLPQKCARAIESHGGEVVCFVEYDATRWGKELLGKPVVSPRSARAITNAETLFVVAIWSPNHSYAETVMWLNAFGITQIEHINALFLIFDDPLIRHYQLSSPEDFARSHQEIARVESMLVEAKSRKIYQTYVRWRASLEVTEIPRAERARVYFDPSLIALPKRAVIVDCGAYDGDSLRMFLKWCGEEFGKYFAFEPDPVTYGKLSDFRSALPSQVAERVKLEQMTVGDTDGSVSFSASGKAGSGGGAGGESISIPSRRLSEYFKGNSVHFLKFDIEGAEAVALNGAEELIRRDEPIIAVAIYHRPGDLFEIPLTVKRLTSGSYSYYVRAHDDDGIDFVFYAVPDRFRG